MLHACLRQTGCRQAARATSRTSWSRARLTQPSTQEASTSGWNPRHSRSFSGSSLHHISSHCVITPLQNAHIAVIRGLVPPPSSPARRYASITTSQSTSSSSSTAPYLHAQQYEYKAFKRQRRRYRTIYILVALGVGTVIAYHFVSPFRQFVIAVERSGAVAIAVAGCIYDYKVLFRTEWDDPAVRHRDYKACHSTSSLLRVFDRCRHQTDPAQWLSVERCAERILAVLKRNGGIYIKLGQHLSSVQLIPDEWSSTMRPLQVRARRPCSPEEEFADLEVHPQDQCFPTPIDEVQTLFLKDVGESIESLFSTFDPDPIGVASLAQVHIATDKISGRKVAVKIMHPDLQEFTLLDMKTTSVRSSVNSRFEADGTALYRSLMLKVVKSFFPTFEFTWLGEEMEQKYMRVCYIQVTEY